MLPSVFGRDLFDDWFDFPFFDDSEMRKAEKRLYGHHEKGIMKTDVQENDTSYNLIMDLPGFKKEDVKVALKDGYLTISAEKSHDHDEEEKKNGKYIRRERVYGSCSRSFYVGEDITDKDIKGEFNHGVLKLTIPKTQPKEIPNTTKYIELD